MLNNNNTDWSCTVEQVYIINKYEDEGAEKEVFCWKEMK